MAYIIVDITKTSIICQLDCSLEAIQGHIILSCVETAKSNIVPQLAFIYSTLNQPPVESESHLRLISVEMVTCDRCNSFHIVVVKVQNLAIQLISLSWVVQQIMDSSDTNS